MSQQQKFDTIYGVSKVEIISAHGNAGMFNMPGEPRMLTATLKWHM